ncbi:MAG: hypothetical protein ACRD4B_10780 [Acidobacteriota bacterium]
MKSLFVTVVLLLIACSFSHVIVAADAEKPTTLSADGGEPGKAYLEYCKAMKDGQTDDLKKLVTSDRAKQMDDPEFAKMFPMIQSMMAKDIKVTGGTMTSKEANLTAEGKDGMTGSVAKGEIHMDMENKQWKVEKDSWKSEMK